MKHCVQGSQRGTGLRFSTGHLLIFLQDITTTPGAEPLDGDGAFFVKRCLATLVYEPGHWIAYAKLGQAWWCLDSRANESLERNPFQNQTQQHIVMQLWFN